MLRHGSFTWKTIAIASSVLLGGCAQTYWTKPGFNAADWQRDNYECERDARMSAASFGGNVFSAVDFFNRCLRAKGYYQARAVDAPGQPGISAEQQAINGRTGSADEISCTKRCWETDGGPACYAACER